MKKIYVVLILALVLFSLVYVKTRDKAVPLNRTATALGVTARVLNVSRDADGRVSFTINSAWDSGKIKDPQFGKLDGLDRHIHMVQTNVAQVHGLAGRRQSGREEHATLAVPRDVKSIDLQQDVHVDRASKKVCFEFKDISLGTLPQCPSEVKKVKIQDTTYYITDLRFSAPIDLSRWKEHIIFGNPSPTLDSGSEVWSWVEANVASPGGECTESLVEAVYGDGKTVAASAEYMDKGSVKLMTIAPVTPKVSFIDGIREIFRRPSGAPHGARRPLGSVYYAYDLTKGGHLLAFKAKDLSNGHFTLRIHATLAPDAKDKGVLRFKDVPIPE